ncbi:chaperonin containing TCP1, group II (cytosolic) [Monocercomonoides exilis]|uniref:chaperonin containing TCP1, group II (cytosolic) n=1 Tax=Monocercomonoides exilis TaxID=2049356 RepID=UPI00355A069D|nr:chaperonin containing TCP1, group II (cytosolic) [Monocercomonoides exilis]|eukprot:MONOS_6498.1-p1 / transcript=MONOS_6498.1 / gene=MONOS_6498 / organism=Monocercomonoides_exilis_PA203 / gene_product=chaperonin containing TCP1, group II (cytosolic) / transcript_product=chaperonin containing TCP1, group II (cytosolic) / location=Mono_scaffold00205:66103-68102(-) / protein_length=600 / sequence_SO=supercontig / SO=protein_coding / is_pseudo=false
MVYGSKVFNKMMRPGNVLVLNATTKRETGYRAQKLNIQAGKEVADVLRTCLGPRAMLKMILSASGSILMTNDGNSIIREIDVKHPAARTIIQLSRAQDEEVGDGTTSVIVLSGEVLAQSQELLERSLHPTIICHSYQRALQTAIAVCDKISKPVDVDNKEEMYSLLRTTLGTKFASEWMEMMCKLAYEAVRRVTIYHNTEGKSDPSARRVPEIDIKRYAKVEKIPGGSESMSEVLDGVMINKDLTHPAMRRRIENPRIVLLDCALEYKKGESQTSTVVTKEEDWEKLLRAEEEEVEKMCKYIIALKPDVVVTEKGLSDLASHYLYKAGISAIRRIRKTDNNRISRATGATIVNQAEELKDTDVGTGCGLFEVKQIGDEFFAYFVKCKEPKACTIVLRGSSKDVLNEIERNLQDAMCVARNILVDPRLLPGGGATEMAVSTALALTAAAEEEGVAQWPRKAIAQAFEVIPRTLAENCGCSVIRRVTELRAKYHEMWKKVSIDSLLKAKSASSASSSSASASSESIQSSVELWGINGETGELMDVNKSELWEPYSVKVQTFKSSVDSACMLLRIDDIVSGQRKKGDGQGQADPDALEKMEE